MQTVYLICHGATVAETQHLCCGKSDLPLCPEGKDALFRLAAQGGYPKAERCRRITSGALRTEQTLQALFGELSHEQNPAFREMDYGDFELQSFQALREREDYQTWLSDAHNRCPGGESGEDVANRVRPAFDALAADGRDTILVTHPGVIAAILTDLFPESGFSRSDWSPEPGKGWAITLEDGKPQTFAELPDAFLGEERTVARKWAFLSAGLLACSVVFLLLYAKSTMEGGSKYGIIVSGATLIACNVIRIVKLRCPYCGKSVAPLRIFGTERIFCPRCGRFYRYGGKR